MFWARIFVVGGSLCCHRLVNFVMVPVLNTFLPDTFSEGQDGFFKSVTIVIWIQSAKEMFTPIIQISYPNKEVPKIIHLICTAAYIMGLGLLYLSASNQTWHTKFALDMIAAFLIAAGQAGGRPLLDTYFDDQLRAGNGKGSKDIDERGAQERKYKYSIPIWILVFLAGPLISLLDTWRTTCMILLFVMGAAFLLFLCGIPFYLQSQPTKRSPNVLVSLFDAKQTYDDGHRHKVDGQHRISE